MRANKKNIIKINSDYIISKIGNTFKKNVLYVGPGDGAYLNHFKFDINNFYLVEKNPLNFNSFKILHPHHKIYNFNILEPKQEFQNFFDIIFSFSLVQYFTYQELLKYNEIIKLYLKNKDSYCVNMSIPNIEMRNAYILNRIFNNKYNLKGFLFDVGGLFIKNNAFFATDGSYWHDPKKLKNYDVCYNSDVLYRFDYSLRKF